MTDGYESKKLGEYEIFYALKRLNKMFCEFGVKESITISGGAVCVLEGLREKTHDIDTYTELSDSRYQALISAIAKKYDYDDDWLNDQPFSVSPQGLPTVKLFSFSNLDVYKLTDESMLISKLKAARSKDLSDACYFANKLKLTCKSQVMSLCRKYDVLFSIEDIDKSIADQKAKEAIDMAIGYIEFPTDFHELQSKYIAEIENRNKFLDRVISECLSHSTTHSQTDTHN